MINANMATQPKWTILQYSASDNNLMPYMKQDINEMERVGSDSFTNMVVQTDDGKEVKRYFLEKDPDMSTINSPVVGEGLDTDMGDPKNLADFIKWGVKNYPSEHVMLVISDHGGGWTGACSDDSAGSWMTMPMIRGALEDAEKETGRKLDVIGFDCCLMANTEVVKEIGDHATFIVASEESEGGDGWPYTPILTPEALEKLQQAQMARINVTPRELVNLVVKGAQGDQASLPTMSGVETAKMGGLYEAIDQLADAIVATKTPSTVLRTLVRSTQGFSYDNLKDMGDFADNILKSDKIKDQALKDAATQIKAQMAEAVIAEEHAPGVRASGLTLEISTRGVPSKYDDLKFAQETRWTQALKKLSS